MPVGHTLDKKRFAGIPAKRFCFVSVVIVLQTPVGAGSVVVAFNVDESVDSG